MTKLTTRIKAIVMAILIGASTVAIGACNTIEGFGEDISDSAKRVKRAL